MCGFEFVHNVTIINYCIFIDVHKVFEDKRIILKITEISTNKRLSYISFLKIIFRFYYGGKIMYYFFDQYNFME